MHIVRLIFVYTLNLYSLVLLGRVLVSWVDPDTRQPISRLLFRLTEPVLAPIRRLLPQNLPLDLSPLIAMVLLILLSRLIALV